MKTPIPNNEEQQPEKSYLEKRREHIQNGRPLKEKKKYYIPKISKKRAEQNKKEKEAGTDKPVDAYFDYHMKNSKPVCQNCGMEAYWLLKPEYSEIWRACHHHILEKRKTMFPSMAGNLDNHLVLFPSWGGLLCGCHGWIHSNWYNASTMEIWPELVRIFKDKLYHLIPEKEKKNIPEALLKETNGIQAS